MTSGLEDGKYWGLGVWVRSRIGQEDAQGCRDFWLRRDCDYQWAILAPTHPHQSRTQEQKTPRPTSLLLLSAPFTCSRPAKATYEALLPSLPSFLLPCHRGGTPSNAAETQTHRVQSSQCFPFPASGMFDLELLLLLGKLGFCTHVQTFRAQFRITTMASIMTSCF